MVTQLPPEPARPEGTGELLPARWGERGRIVMVGPGSKRQVLTEGFDSAADPDVSFDGRRMLFAGKRGTSDPWAIFEMDLATRRVRAVSVGAGSRRSPIYQGMLYTITASEPWQTITFVGEEARRPDEPGDRVTTSLRGCKLDGSEERRLTFNPASALHPAVLPDGRLVFSQWQRGGMDRREAGRVALFTSHIDGIDYAIFSGDEGRAVKLMPSFTAGGLVVFVESDAAPWDGAGSLASVTLRRNLHSYEAITEQDGGLFHSPSPLPDGTILVSRRPADGSGTHGVVRLDPLTGKVLERIFDDPAAHDVQAKLLAPRAVPDGRSSVVSEKEPTGILYGLNVFTSDLEGHGWITQGTPYRLRVLEGMPREAGDAPAPDRDAASDAGPVQDPARASGERGVRSDRFTRQSDLEGSGARIDGTSRPASPLMATSSRLPMRLLGEVDIEPDGSFNVQVPANTPVRLQIVDEDGLAVRTSDWIWARNKEARGCVGCHEDGEMAPENRLVAAIQKAPIPLTLPPERRRTVGFRRDVMPILTSKCAAQACHGGAAAPDLTDHLWLGRYVHPGRARTSPLVWHLFGRDTTRPWDRPVEGYARTGTPGSARFVPKMPPPGFPPLTDDDRRTIVEWIDLGATWEGVPGDPYQDTAAAEPPHRGPLTLENESKHISKTTPAHQGHRPDPTDEVGATQVTQAAEGGGR